MTITELRFADDLMATCHSHSLLQEFINRFTKAAETWGLAVSTTKSKAMIQQSGLPLSASSPVSPPSFFINDNQIEVVSHFQYLGSVLSHDTTLDKEITTRISRAAGVFSNLKSPVRNNPNLSQRTKLAVYQAAVLPALLYGAETWTTTTRLLNRLECFHMDSIHQAMGVSKLAHIPNITLRAKAKIPPIATLIKLSRLR
eukprot:Em0013g368a